MSQSVVVPRTGVSSATVWSLRDSHIVVFRTRS